MSLKIQLVHIINRIEGKVPKETFESLQSH